MLNISTIFLPKKEKNFHQFWTEKDVKGSTILKVKKKLKKSKFDTRKVILGDNI